jgi:GntR family transcriptional regulator / MocR family aminotransferase
VDLFIPLDRSLTVPLRDQVYTGLRAAILDGRLSLGARLPASRVLARSLGVSRFTVDDAFGRLIADGYLVGRHGSGTYVAYGPSPPPLRNRLETESRFDSHPRRWSIWAARLTNLPPAVSSAFSFSFKQGVPALDQFPHAVWRRCHSEATRHWRTELQGYGSTEGYAPFREQIAAYLARARMLRCSPDQVVVTTGTQQALDLIARLFVDPGDAVAVEEPGYPTARRVLRAAGARLLPVPVDGDGLCTDRLPDIEAAKLIYVTPSHQFPTGGVLPLSRRRALIEWAHATRTLILEDDYDSEFRYGQRPVEALAALESSLPGSGSVVYIGTFSKVLYPSLRLGYLVLPPDLVPGMRAAKDVTDRHPSTAEQATLAAFMVGGHFERHLARMRRVYACRLAALENALARHFGDRAVLDAASTAAGLHLLVWFDLPYDEAEMVRRATASGIQIDPASPCFQTPPIRPGALLGYAVMDEPAIEAGIATLAAALLG